MTIARSIQKFIIGTHYPSQRKCRIILAFIASLISHTLLIIYFGSPLTTKLPDEINSRMWLSVILQSRKPPEVRSTSQPVSLESSNTYSSKLDKQTERKTKFTGLPLISQGKDSRNFAIKPLAAPFPKTTIGDNPDAQIDLEAAYTMARQHHNASPYSNQKTTNPAPQMIEQETQLAHHMAKSARPNCRTVHASLGLFAIPLLIADTFSETGCQW